MWILSGSFSVYLISTSLSRRWRNCFHILSLYVWSIFFKCSVKKFRQIINSLYKRTNVFSWEICMFTRRKILVLQWVISSWGQLRPVSHFEDIFENWNSHMNTVMSTFWLKHLSSLPPAFNSKDFFHVTCTCILNMWPALWPFYIDNKHTFTNTPITCNFSPCITRITCLHHDEISLPL